MRLAAVMTVAALSVTATAQRQVYDPGDGVTSPIIVREVKPTYTQQAKVKKIGDWVFGTH